MRLGGVLLLLLGLFMAAGGAFVGCGSLFAWNGRHPVQVTELTPGEPVALSVETAPGRRYTAGVQVRFAREGPRVEDGLFVVEARMPLVATLEDASGTALRREVGWLDPAEPPTVVVGHAAQPPSRGTEPDLVAERFVGPVTASGRDRLTARVDLGTDQLGKARIVGARLVVYDDALPRAVVVPLAAAGAGAVLALAGAVVLVVGFFRRGRSRRGGIRPRAEE